MKISIITPSFNQAQFIERTIDSVLGQRGDFELEYLVVDGGSNDGTLDILRAYGDRFRWVSEKDRGQTDAINKGLRMSSGDVLAYLNSDDVLKPGALQAVAEAFGANASTMWLTGRCDIIDEHDVEIRTWITAYKNFWLDRGSRFWFFVENPISQMATFWRRAAYEEIGEFNVDLRYVMDYEYWARLWLRFPPQILPNYLASFRWYEESKSGSHYADQFGEELEVARRLSPSRLAVQLHAANVAKIVGSYTIMRSVRRLSTPPEAP